MNTELVAMGNLLIDVRTSLNGRKAAVDRCVRLATDDAIEATSRAVVRMRAKKIRVDENAAPSRCHGSPPEHRAPSKSAELRVFSHARGGGHRRRSRSLWRAMTHADVNGRNYGLGERDFVYIIESDGPPVVAG